MRYPRGGSIHAQVHAWSGVLRAFALIQLRQSNINPQIPFRNPAILPQRIPHLRNLNSIICVAALEAEIAKLKEEKEAKPFVGKPWQKIDYTAGFKMPASCVEEMAKVVPDIARGNASGVTVTKAVVGEEKPKVKGTGWIDATPLGPRADTKHIDRIASFFADQDKLDQVAKIAAAIKAVKK